MALIIIKFERRFLLPLIAASAILCLIAGWHFAKWNFANVISMHADTKDIADLAVSMAPGDPQTHYAAAVIYEKTFDNDDLTRSLKEYEIVAALSPNNYFSWLALGRARGQNGDTAGAGSAYLRALDLAPNYAVVQWAYGNALIRAGHIDEGFLQMGLAADAKSEYVNPSVVTAMTFFDGDAERTRKALGSTPAVNAGMAAFELSNKNYDKASTAWDMIPANEKRTNFRDLGETLISRFVVAKQFRLAARVAKDIWDGEGPSPEAVFNGGFESPIKLRDARLFDWQIGPGAEPQIGLNEEQKHSGGYSLFMKFNTMQSADFRSFSQMVAVEPGKSYSLDGFYRADLKGALVWEIADAGGGKSLAKSTSVNGSADWTEFRVNFMVPGDSDGIVIRLARDGCVTQICPISGKVWFDDLRLSR